MMNERSARVIVLSMFVFFALLETGSSYLPKSLEIYALASTGRNIDVYTQKGGQGNSTRDGSFGPLELVILYANVTYNSYPMQNKDVVFEILDPYLQHFAAYYSLTNVDGIATLQFRLPWTCDNPEYYFGNWTVRASTDIAGITVVDTMQFEYRMILYVPDNFPTIQAAINYAEEGDLVFVRSGTYYEHLVVNKTLTLFGEDRNTTIVDGEYLFPSVVNVTANNVKISGFTIQHCPDGGRALWLNDYVNMTFSYNIITGCNEGVRLVRSSGNVVSDNIVQDCYYNTGVGIDYGFNNTVYRNTIIDNHYGLSGGIDCHGNTFSENTIINNDIGFGTTSYDNKFFHNNFVSNGVNVIVSGINQFDNGCEGNYWSDYTGIDADGDGIGDTPYVINENNQDNYPLMNLYWNPGDIDHDLDIDIFDLVRCASAYGSTPSSPNWNPHCDIAEPYGIVNIFDLVTIAGSYGKKYNP